MLQRALVRQRRCCYQDSFRNDDKSVPTYALTPTKLTVTANSHVLNRYESSKLGRVGVVIGGTGVVGRHLCNELASRHVTTFSISRRGGVQDVDHKHLPYLDEVNWVQGDIEDDVLWEEMLPILKDAGELHICLPRTEEGAELAQTIIKKYKHRRFYPLCISITSVADHWRTVSSDTQDAWRYTETMLANEYPRDHLILKPGAVHCEGDYTASAEVANRMKRMVHKRLMRDNLDKLVGENPMHGVMSLTRFIDTKASGRFIPSVHAVDVARAALSTNVPDLKGGVLREYTPYAITLLPHLTMYTKATIDDVNDLRSVHDYY